MFIPAQSEARANAPSLHNISTVPRNILFSFPGVYIFRASNGDVLYVGSSVGVLGRARKRASHVGRNKAFQELNSIEIFRCDSPEQARHLEAELIGLYKPKYNKLSIYLYSKTFRQLQAEHEKVFAGRSL